GDRRLRQLRWRAGRRPDRGPGRGSDSRRGQSSLCPAGLVAGRRADAAFPTRRPVGYGGAVRFGADARGLTMNTSVNASVLGEATSVGDALPSRTSALQEIDLRAAAGRRKILVVTGLLVLLLATAPLWAGSSFGLARYSVA